MESNIELIHIKFLKLFFSFHLLFTYPHRIRIGMRDNIKKKIELEI